MARPKKASIDNGASEVCERYSTQHSSLLATNDLIGIRRRYSHNCESGLGFRHSVRWRDAKT